MLTRLRSFKLTLLLAYALVLQGVAVATAASARQQHVGASGWCITSPLLGAVTNPAVPAAPLAHDGACCFGVCASGASAIQPHADTPPPWAQAASERAHPVATLARLREHPAHPWSPRAPPVA